jgi:hypothetical protein
MRHHSLFMPLLVAILPLAQPARAASDADAQALVEAWCQAVMTRNEVAAVGLMSPDLQAAVAEARTASDAFAASHPDEKPPLGDGLPITSFPDGVSECTGETVTTAGAMITLSAGAGATWTDSLAFLTGPDGALKVADIYYAPDHVISLSEALQAMSEPVE